VSLRLRGYIYTLNSLLYQLVLLLARFEIRNFVARFALTAEERVTFIWNLYYGVFMADKQDKILVLFLCTGNACRSQMAEGWANKLKRDSIVAFSAGVIPAGLSTRATQVMAEAGVDISHQYSKHISELTGINFDYVITLCDNARESCPVFLGKSKIIHKPFADPAFATGSEEMIMNAFRKTRDDIKDFIMTLPEKLEEEIN